MNKPVVHPVESAAAPEDGEVDRFMAENHDYYADLVEQGRLSAERGEAEPMPPLDELLAEVRRAHARRA